MASTSKDRKDIEWLYPDLLSKEGLVHILKQRFIRTDETHLESLDKDSLVNLYNQYILPLPQRKYRNNRHGRDMTKRQILFSKKRKIHIGDEDETTNKRSRNSFQDGPAQGLVNSFNGSNSSGSRLKPPPTCVDYKRKTIQLSSNKSHSDISPITCSQPNSEKKVLKLKSSSGDDGLLAKKIKLDNVTQSSQTHKGLSKITWP